MSALLAPARGVVGSRCSLSAISFLALLLACLLAACGGGGGGGAPVTDSSGHQLLLFAAYDASYTYGNELWKTDGTPEGTAMVRDINPGNNGSDPEGFVTMGGYVYFAAFNSDRGNELWRSDGTEAGTTLVVELNFGDDGPCCPYGSDPHQLTAVGETLFFVANDGSYEWLWKSNGAIGNAQIVDPDAWSECSVGGNYPDWLTAAGNRLYFTATDCSTVDYETWFTNGTSATPLDLAYPGESQGSSPHELAAIGGMLYFSGDDGFNGDEPWAFNGSELVSPGNLSSDSSSAPKEFTGVGGTVFFSAYDDTERSLWKTDGSAGSAQELKSGLNLDPQYLTAFAGKLFFSGDDQGSGAGRELWSSNGTDAGTQMVRDIYDDGSSYPSHLLVVNGILFFIANDTNGSALWMSDGTVDGTQKVPGMPKINYCDTFVAGVNDKIVVSFYNTDTSQYELWASDGTLAGTRTIAALGDNCW